MPLVRISFKQDKTAAFRQSVADAIHGGLIAVGVPEHDRFQIMSSHGEDLIYDANFLDVARSDGIIIVQIFLAAGRTVDKKRALYRGIVERLARECQVRPEDVFINLVECAMENWSFGNGAAQYADVVPPHLTQTV
jgi:4-oxalocrotonate tautomerase